MKTPYKLTSETSLSEIYLKQITPFWQNKVVQNSFDSDDGIRINYCYCLCPDAKATVVLSPGRTESYMKYQEFIYDLYQNGFSVFAIDHRGQGLSGRLIDHPQKGYVDDFQHYVDDFHYFYHHVVVKHANAPLCLVGHSMGGAIGTLYLEQNPDDFVGAVMSAPLHGFRPGPLPLMLSKWLVRGIIGIKSMLRQSTDYFWGQMDYVPLPFEGNRLTHSRPRYEQFRQQFSEVAELRLGGITFHWLATALRAMERQFSNIKTFKTPMLLIQSCDDEIVNQAEQNRFYKKLQQLNNCAVLKKVELHGSKHEVFFESDLMRTRAMHNLIEFVEQVARAKKADPHREKHGVTVTEKSKKTDEQSF